MEKVSYDEERDILYITLSDNPYKEVINTKVLALYMDMDGNLCRIGIKNAKERGIIDDLTKALLSISA